MKLRGVILLVFASSMLVQQLPLDPGERREIPSCCALAGACPMSARPQTGARVGDSCAKNGSSTCSVRARCPMGGRDEDPMPGQVVSRPAVLEASGWVQALLIETAGPRVESSVPPAPGKSPPTPPPRRSRS